MNLGISPKGGTMAKSLPDTRLLDLFGIELPIVQAPMANSSGVDMAVAVAEAGRFGSFPCAGLSDDKVRDGMAAIRSRTQKPINLNFFCHEEPERNLAREAAWLERLAPYYKELGAEMPKLPLLPTIYRFTDATCAAVEELRPEVVSFHFGLPAPDLLARVKKAGCKIISRPRHAARRFGSQSAASMRSSPRALRPAAIAACSSKPTWPRRSAVLRWCRRSRPPQMCR